MTTIMLAGDVHGRLDHVRDLCKWANKAGCQRLVMLGDWGFTWDPAEVDRYLLRQSELAEEFGLELAFIDGNHENFDVLEDLGAFGAEEAVEISPHLWYLPRGSVQEWGGLRWLACGGAVSVDKDPMPGWPGRTEGVSWWPQELITEADVERCKAQGQVDILLSHDAPPTLGLQAYLDEYSRIIRLPYKLDALSEKSRQYIAEIVLECRPEFVFHGHYHHRYNGTFDHGDDFVTKVIGIDRDKQGAKSYVIVDTDLFPWAYTKAES